MKKADKQVIKKMINDLIADFGFTFRFRETYDDCADREGYCDLRAKEIVVKQSGGYDTVAHEVAHIIQYVNYGATSCASTRVTKANKAVVVPLQEQFLEIEAEQMILLSKCGIERAWNKAIGSCYMGEDCYVHPKRRGL